MDTKKIVNIILNNPAVHSMYVKTMIEESLKRQSEEFERLSAENAALRKKHKEANARIAANNAESERMLNELERLIAKI